MSFWIKLNNWFKRIDADSVDAVVNEIVERETKRIEIAIVVIIVAALHIFLFVLGYFLFVG